MNQVKDFFEYIFNAIKIWIIVQPWQTGIRVRSGKNIKKLAGGIYFRLPYFDSVFIQENRLRVVSMPIQTLTSKDIKTITINGAVGYTIIDIEKLYQTLYHPETTIANITMSEVADFIFRNNLESINPNTIEKAVISKLNKEYFGLKFEYFRITNFAVVRTFRLIQDQSWISEGLSMNDKK
jgi:regulator of protease activity HflC (stomatin/prohibitin superfamily)